MVGAAFSASAVPFWGAAARKIVSYIEYRCLFSIRKSALTLHAAVMAQVLGRGSEVCVEELPFDPVRRAGGSVEARAPMSTGLAAPDRVDFERRGRCSLSRVDLPGPNR